MIGPWNGTDPHRAKELLVPYDDQSLHSHTVSLCRDLVFGQCSYPIWRLPKLEDTSSIQACIDGIGQPQFATTHDVALYPGPSGCGADTGLNKSCCTYPSFTTLRRGRLCGDLAQWQICMMTNACEAFSMPGGLPHMTDCYPQDVQNVSVGLTPSAPWWYGYCKLGQCSGLVYIEGQNITVFNGTFGGRRCKSFYLSLDGSSAILQCLSW